MLSEADMKIVACSFTPIIAQPAGLSSRESGEEAAHQFSSCLTFLGPESRGMHGQTLALLGQVLKQGRIAPEGCVGMITRGVKKKIR